MSTPAPDYATTTPAEGVTIHHGDCLDVLRAMPAESVHAVVTDPPYGLGFMGREWDALPPGREWAAECLRVLKPGGHLLAFGGTRTWHRLAVAVEDAGFEVRDSLAWLYGSGFSKAGLLGNKKGLTWCECGGNALPYDHASNPDLLRMRSHVHPSPVPRREGEDASVLPSVQREATGGGMEEARPQGPRRMDGNVGGVIPREDVGRPEPGLEGRIVHRAGQGVSDDPQAGAPSREGERVRGGTPARHGGDDRSPGHASRGGAPHQPRPGGQPTGEPEAVSGSHVALDDGALRGRAECPRCGGLDPAYRGFSTALKPAFEPIVMARKPLAGTVAANVLEHGTGALNIDACRVYATDDDRALMEARSHPNGTKAGANGGGIAMQFDKPHGFKSHPAGRWPANVMLDESQAAELDRQVGPVHWQATNNTRKRSGWGVSEGKARRQWDAPKVGAERLAKEGPGLGPSKFFYVAKAPKSERPVVDGIAHPTVKPLALMRQLCRLVTPPGGVILEPFAGSGTTVEAAMLEGFDVVGIEREAEYLPLIGARVQRALEARAREADAAEVRLF